MAECLIWWLGGCDTLLLLNYCGILKKTLDCLLHANVK